MNIIRLPEYCTGCGACSSVCPKQAISIKDNINSFIPVIDENVCVKCGKCLTVCPNNHYPPSQLFSEAFQGWSKDQDIRKNSSSGGIASAIMYSFIRKGGYICSCRADTSGFNYIITNKIEDVCLYCGSKYVKSNVNDSYTKVYALLKQGESVLFIGLPCHVAGLLNYIEKRYQEKLYTIDLICHGAPSIKLLENYCHSQGVKMEKWKDITFREKTKFGLLVTGKKLAPRMSYDEYTYSFLKGLTYYEACYECKSARLERISDITLGDAWGSEINDQIEKGISLVLCQTLKGRLLLDNDSILLRPIDVNNAIRFNKQLSAPSEQNPLRNRFFKVFTKTGSFIFAFMLCYPVFSIKQIIKKMIYYDIRKINE